MGHFISKNASSLERLAPRRKASLKQRLERRRSSSIKNRSSALMTLPEEVRIKIISKLDGDDRRTLRLVCRQLCDEVDALVGPAGPISICDKRCKRALRYFSQCRLESIEISRRCLHVSPETLLTHPSFLKSFRLLKGGVISPEFLLIVLRRCVNLKCLSWCGVVRGLLNPFGPLIPLPNLRRLLVNSEDMSSSTILDSEIAALVNALHRRPTDLNSKLTFWHNQLALLRRLCCPKLVDATFYLYTCENAQQEDADEVELLFELFRFISRHQSLYKLVVYHAQQPALTDSRAADFQHPLTFFNRSFRPLLQAAQDSHSSEMEKLHQEHSSEFQKLLNCQPTMIKFPSSVQPQIREVMFSSQLGCMFHNDPLRNFESYFLKMLQALDCLEVLKYCATKGRPLPWLALENVVRANLDTLRHFEVQGKLEGDIDFSSFAHCPNIQVIKINNHQKYRHASFSPVIENFGPHPSMIRNLKILIIQNMELRYEDFENLSNLQSLEYLGITRWRSGSSESTLTLKGIRGVLTMRSLNGLLIPWPRTFALEDEEDRQGALQLTNMLSEANFLHPPDVRRFGIVQYLCIYSWHKIPREKRLWEKTQWGVRINNSFLPDNCPRAL